MLGRECLLPCTFIAQPPEDSQPASRFVADFRETLRAAHKTVRDSLRTSARTEKAYFDRRVKTHHFVVGQLVYLYWPRPLIKQKHRKLSRLWTGPWRISQFVSPFVVIIQNVRTNRKQTVHVDRLVPCTQDVPHVQASEPAVDDSTITSQQSHTASSDPTDNSLSVTHSGPQRPIRIRRRPSRYRD